MKPNTREQSKSGQDKGRAAAAEIGIEPKSPISVANTSSWPFGSITKTGSMMSNLPRIFCTRRVIRFGR
jgi:hypothetical protein